MGWAVAPFSFNSSISSSRMPRARRSTAFDGRVDRLDDAEAHVMIAIGGDAVDVLQEEVSESFDLGQALPPKRLKGVKERRRVTDRPTASRGRRGRASALQYE